LLGLVRFFLAAVVLGTHFSYFTADRSWWITVTHDLGGKAAVLGFMLVSGYSIAASINVSERGFYLRRFLRIYPLYFTAVIVTFAVEIFCGGHADLFDRAFDALGWKTALGNAFMLQTFVVKPMAFNTPLWSLSVEVFFYLCAPLFIKLPRAWIFGIVVFSLSSFMLPQHDDWGVIYFVLSKFNALRYMWAWLLGFLLFGNRSVALSAFAVACSAVVLFHEHTPEKLSIVTYLVAAGAVLMARHVPSKLLEFRGIEFLGDFSYPMYLFHYPALISAYVLGIRSTAVWLILALVLPLAAHMFVDQYLKSRYLAPWLKRRFGRNA
jgi:peptidoglycan/LPS O-acetylase OafA/YrhL